MFGSDILEVAVGLAVVFLLGSLLCSAINEIVLGVLLHTRSKHLWTGLKRILRDSDFAERLRSHPLVESLRTGAKRDLTYLPAWTFVDTVFALALRRTQPAPRDTVAMTEAADAADAVDTDAGIDDTEDDDSETPAIHVGPPDVATLQRLRDAVQQSLPISIPGAGESADDPAATRTAVGPAGQAGPGPLPAETAVALDALLLSCRDLADARARIAQWFNDAMDRVSGEYKRMAQMWLVGWATMVVLVANIDSIQIAEHFYGAPEFRRAVADAVPGVLEAVAPLLVTNAPAGTPEGDVSMKGLTAAIRTVTTATGEYQRLGLPIGWTRNPEISVRKCLGLFLTIAAFAMGAPFWFDLLNKLVNLRAGGKPPPPTPNPPAQKPAS